MFSGLVSHETHQIVEFEVTEVIEEYGWQQEEDLRVVLERSSELGVPPPILIERFGDRCSPFDHFHSLHIDSPI